MSIVMCCMCDKIVDLDWNVEDAAADEITCKWYCIDCIEEKGWEIGYNGYITKQEG